MSSTPPSRSEQKKAVALLSIGSFLESFDLFLYVHIAVLLNELFFPPTDPHTAKLLSAFVFCTTFVLRPLGALVFGYIGDRVGRKATVVMTTMMMAGACLVMAVLPTYAQIGITASWIVIACRVVQGLSVLGERLGAELYLTELTKPPFQYVMVGLIACAVELGGVCAVGISALVTSHGLSWRLVFFMGAAVAVIGAMARTRLKESPHFAHGQQQGPQKAMQRNTEATSDGPSAVPTKTSLAYFLIQCVSPVGFYLIYFYCGGLLRDTFGCTAHEVLSQNFIVGLIQLTRTLALSFLSGSIYPLKILKARALAFLLLMLAGPWILNTIGTPLHLLGFQALAVILIPSGMPAGPIFYKHFPIFRRFTYSGVLFAMSRAVMNIIASFGLVYLIQQFGYWGLLLLVLPVVLGYIWGVRHFEQLEIAAGNYPGKTHGGLILEAT